MIQVSKEWIDFLFSFEDDAQRPNHRRYTLSTVEIKNWNTVIDRRTFYDEPVKNDAIVSNNIRKVAAGQGDDYMTGCLLDYPNFKENYKISYMQTTNTWCWSKGNPKI